MTPDYKQIYTDLLTENFPEKLAEDHIINKLDNLHSAIDVLKLNQLIFGEQEYREQVNNRRLRSYDEDSIIKILRYQRENNLSNIQLSNHFKMSRNTITKWKLLFKI